MTLLPVLPVQILPISIPSIVEMFIRDAMGNSDVESEFLGDFDYHLHMMAGDEEVFENRGSNDNHHEPGSDNHLWRANELMAAHDEAEHSDNYGQEEGGIMELTTSPGSKVFEEKDCLPSSSEMSEAERLEHTRQALLLKEEGNKLFTKGDYEGARSLYGEGLTHCPARQKESAMLFSNLAACDMKQSIWKNAILHCSQAITMDPTYTKVYYRRATAYEQSDKSADLSKALEGR